MDLNIINLDDMAYTVTAVTESGKKSVSHGSYDLFNGGHDYSDYFTPIVGKDSYLIRFNTDNIEFDQKTGKCMISGENLRVENPYDRDYEWEKADYAEFEKETVKYIMFERRGGRSLHYAV